MKKLIFYFSTFLLLLSCKKETVTELDRPIGLNVSKGLYGNKIILSWIPIPKAFNYQVYKFDSLQNDYLIIAETPDTSYIDSTVQQKYIKTFYKIKIYNSENEYSNFSDVDYGYINGKDYDLISSFGSEGSGLGQFSSPEHLAIDNNESIYVSDPNNGRIQKFDKNGNFLEVFFSCISPRSVLFLEDKIVIAKSEDNKIHIMDYNKQVIKEWGSFGAEAGQFFYFRQIAVDDENNLYVVDHNNNRVQKFDLEGNFLLKWGNKGQTEGNFVYPWGIAYINNKIIVSSGTRVQFFTKTGDFIKQWDLGITIYDIRVHGSDIYLACGGFIIKTDENHDVEIKIGEGDFGLVTSVVIDSNNNLIANDISNRRISFYQKLK